MSNIPVTNIKVTSTQANQNAVLTFNSEELIERGKGLKFDLPHLGERVTGFVIRFNGKAFAYVNQCAHVSIELDWEEGQFFNITQEAIICATHGAMYMPESGLCFAGPCKGRGLKPLKVTESEGTVFVETDVVP